MCGMGAHGFFQPPSDAIAYDGIADFLGDGVTDARRSSIAPIENLNEKKPSTAFFTTPHGQKFRTLEKPPGLRSRRLTVAGQRTRFRQALSRLRPRLRRAAMTARPPLVAMRARKPWRRLRTSLEGW
jgi:hypothetical protein